MKYPDWISLALKDFETVTRIVALMIGGIWAYMKFVKGRIFYSRLELNVSGTAFIREYYASLTITATVKNVGLSRVNINHDGSALRVLANEATTLTPSAIMSAEWTLLGAFPILEKHAWIEPGELVGEDRLVILPKEASHNVLLELIIASGRIEWDATCIIALNPEDKRD